MKQAVRQFARFYLPIAVYLMLAFFLFRYAADAAVTGQRMSLRYTDTPLTAQQAANARGYVQDEDTQSDYDLAFWSQTLSVNIKNDFGTSDASVFYIDGNMQGVYPVNFIAGSYPTAIDTNGIAVSEMLGWRLFGGGNLIGAELNWNGQIYTVRGVFEGLEPIMLVQTDAAALDKEHTFTGVELYGTPQFGDPRDTALTFAAKAGLGTPTAVVDGDVIVTLMVFMAVLPACILVGWFIIKLLQQLHRLQFWQRQLIWFAVLLALAFTVPWVMAKLPGWMIPNKWSDLDSWSEFFTTVRARVNELLGLYPSLRDVQVKKDLFRQVALLIPALFSVGITIRVWRQRIEGLFDAQASAVLVEAQIIELEPDVLIEADGTAVLLENVPEPPVAQDKTE